jgi:hypothetical protein
VLRLGILLAYTSTPQCALNSRYLQQAQVKCDLCPLHLETAAKLAGRLVGAELFVRLQLINKLSTPLGEQIHVIFITGMCVVLPGT